MPHQDQHQGSSFDSPAGRKFLSDWVRHVAGAMSNAGHGEPVSNRAKRRGKIPAQTKPNNTTSPPTITYTFPGQLKPKPNHPADHTDNKQVKQASKELREQEDH